MLEICFSNSLKGSLMCAKEKRGGRVIVASVFGWNENGHPPTEEEIEIHKRKVQEEHEKAQAEMIPLGGTGRDVFCFPGDCHIGDVSAIDKDEQWENFKKHLKNDSELRIWYDPQNPADVCGLYCFLWTLKQKELALKMWLMPLPDYFQNDDGSIVVCRGWAEIVPEKLGHHLHLQKVVSEGFLMMACTTWEKLRQENAALRTIINGKITSVPIDFYDGVILEELKKQPEEFKEVNFIAELLYNTCLSAMGDEYIHQRLMSLVKKSQLELIASSDDGSYRGQILRKITQ